MMFVIDIEGRGRSVTRNGIISIGVCVGTGGGSPYPRVIEKKRFDLQPFPEQSMDPKCKAEFWDKQPPHLLELLQRNATPPMTGITEFRAYLDEWHAKDPMLYIVSDNPAYDFAFIDAYLDRTGLPTLAYHFDAARNLVFSALHDADSYARGFRLQEPHDPWVSNKGLIETLELVTRDPNDCEMPTLIAHLPEDDAEEIYRFHYALINQYRNNKRQCFQ